MSRSAVASYQDRGLSAAVVDLVRVGTTGHGAGVRQLATRLLREIPSEVTDPAEFRRAVHEAMSTRPPAGLRFAGGAVPTDSEGTHALVDVNPLPDGTGLVLDRDVQAELDDVVAERLSAPQLAGAGVAPTSTVLISGPPGVGKTMAARWLAQAAGLPLVVLDLAAVVSSYLGTSGRNIRSVLDYAKSGPCVLLLDEFDAIAPRRDDDADVGELRRVVNVVLVELDRWPSTSLLVAATNHARLLDPAIERRFDRVIHFGLPGRDGRAAMLQTRAAATGAQVSEEVLELVAAVSDGASGSDLERRWNAAVRRSVLSGTGIDDELLAQEVRMRHRAGPARDALWRVISERLGWSHRQIADMAGVTHPTVGNAIRKARMRSERDDNRAAAKALRQR